MQLAVFEAVNATTADYHPYLGTIVAPPGASPDAAAIEAAYMVLSTYFQGSAGTLLNSRNSYLAAIPDSQSKTDGIATSDAAAAATMALRANDGSLPPKFYTPLPPAPGVWQATPSCPVNDDGVAVGLFFQWQNVIPFGIPDAHAYPLDPPPALTSNLYAKAYNEVMTVGSLTSTERPQDRSNVARFYAASPPVLVFNQAAGQVAQQQGRSLSENARALALVNMAINDSLVASFFNRYHYNFWRPETAIHAGATDGNPKTEADTSFVPFIGPHVSRAIHPTTAAEVMVQPRSSGVFTERAGIRSRCQTPRCQPSSFNTRALSRFRMTSLTLAFTAEFISAPTRWQVSV